MASREPRETAQSLDGWICVLRDAFRPTCDRWRLGGHHGAREARFGAATRRIGPVIRTGYVYNRLVTVL
jgi:hypothetical protein